MKASTSFRKLNEGWNAEPNAPSPEVIIDGRDLVLRFELNAFQFSRFSEGQCGHVRFIDAMRYRLGTVNDEGWNLGQCRFSHLAPEWGEFYEVSGDLLIDKCPNDWIEIVATPPDEPRKHYLFYFRDEEFECDATDWRFEAEDIPTKD